MSLTKEQALEQAHRSIETYRKAEKLKVGVHRAKVYMFIALVVGIFFFPVLVIALICFALYYFGNKEVDALMQECQRLESIPEVGAALNEITASASSNP